MEIISSQTHLSCVLEESAFLDKEFLEIEPEQIYIDPVTGMPGFIVAPITGNTTGMLRRHWMERLYSSLSFLLFAGDGAVKYDSHKCDPRSTYFVNVPGATDLFFEFS